ncbi:ABC transporter ATP-binding protein [bacterium]|nr:ABC transporter ATP-binding protein [bacterium]
MADVVIQTRNLTRTYVRSGGKPFNAVDNLNLEINSGEIFAFLGVNGTGKTTTMKMLLGLTFPSSGSSTILGGEISNRSIRSRIGYLPEESGLYPFLRVEDVLRFHARLFGNTRKWRSERIEAVINFAGLKNKAREQLKNLSKGFRQRVGIAQALINDPELIFFDEPASGLDPIGIKDLRAMMLRLKEDGKTVFLNSHQLSEVELVADRIGMIHEGRLIKIGVLKELLGTDDSVEIQMSNISEDNARKLIKDIPELNEDSWDVEGISEGVVVYLDISEFTDEIIAALMSAGAKINSVNKRVKTLEDLFSEVMQETQIT